uniref:Methyltransf_FA domain-containing protein n=1 Tax=Caenorhabditis tropicalis TaxID=1561998 RepID=A0A1I7UYV4_9PELO
MSSVSEKDHEVLDSFDYGDDVSIIDRSEIVDWSTIIIKIFLGLLFIGFASGCIIYSVITSEEYTHPASTNSSFFVFDVSQHCDNGTLTWTNRTGSFNDYDRVTTGISWLQDSQRKRIYHRIGIAKDNKDWKITHYVFVNHTFFVDRNGCNKIDYGYDEYLRRLGFQKIRMQREEYFTIEEGESVKVNYFEGEPSLDIQIEGIHPNLVRAFTSPDNKFTYAWEYIFPQTAESTGLFRKDYWYPEMKPGVDDEGVFEELPSSCYKQS